MSTDQLPRDRGLSLGIALLCAGSLLFELVLTRLFSVVLWYHFAFAVISLAMLGIGAGGIWLYVRPERFPPERLRSQLAACALGFGLAAPGATLLMIGVAPIPGPSAASVVSISIHFLAAATPFVFVGLAVALALTHRTEIAGRIYAADLVGAGLGCFSVVWLLGVLDLGGSVLVIGILGVVASLVLGAGVGGRRVGLGPAVSLAALAVLLALHAASPWFTVQVTKSGLEETREWEAWNAFSRIAVFPSPTPGRPLGWGLSRRWEGEAPREKMLVIDGTASSPILRWNGTEEGLAALEYLDWDVTSLGHHLRPGGACVIVGPGGGRDLLTARRFGQRRIIGLEINPAIWEAMTGRYAPFSGHIYDRAPVEVIVDEARSWLERREERCDLLQISMIDTWAATAAGSFVFTEAHLYTLEAFEVFRERLAPGGLLAVSRWFSGRSPGETLRLEALALEAWRRAGVEHPERHMAILASEERRGVGTLLMGRDPLTADDVALLHSLAEEMGFLVVWLPDGSAPPSPHTELATAADPEAFVANYRLDLSPPTDDRPFFFHMLRLRDVVPVLLGEAEDLRGAFAVEANRRALLTLLTLLVLVTLFAVAFILVPLLAARRADLSASRGRWRWPLLAYFACLGLGFMMVEVPQIQRLNLFLGHPVYAFSVVLATLLVGGGCGSFAVRRVVSPEAAQRWLRWLLPAIVALVLVFTWGQPVLLRVGLPWPTPGRITAAVLQLAPLGILLGTALPLGLQIAAGRVPRLVPWLWGLNGALGVVGSVGALCLGLLLGFSVALLVGAGAYLLAWVLVAGRR